MSINAPSDPRAKNAFQKAFASFGVAEDRDYFVENLSLLMASGMTMSEALTSVSAEIRTKKVRRYIAQMVEDIESGTPLWKALDYTGLFPSYVIALVRIGEESGKLVQNLKVVSQQQRKDRAFRSKIRSAMMYPVFVLVLTLVVGTGIAWFILPKLALVFSQLHLKLPLITKILISGGVFLGTYGSIVIPIFMLGLATLMYLVFYFPATRFIGQYMLFSTPGIKRLIKEVELARFGYLLGTLLEAGLPIVMALDSLSHATQFPFYRKLYVHVKERIALGDTFKACFASYKNSRRLLPMPVQQLVIAGEQSGGLSGSLIKIGETYDEKTEATAKDLTVILEPILLVIVWLGVVSVALAVILPIYNLVGQLNDSSTGQPVQQNAPAEAPPQESVVPTTPTTEPAATTPATPVKTPQAAAAATSTLTKVQVLDAGLGYLKVRSMPSTSSDIVAKVMPGDILEYIDQQYGWYKVVLHDGSKGWIYGEYVKIISTP